MTTIQLKDMVTVAHDAVKVIKSVCRNYDGHCIMCPLGVFTGSDPKRNPYPHEFKCAFKEFVPKDMELQPVKPTRLVKSRTFSMPDIKTDFEVIG